MRIKRALRILLKDEGVDQGRITELDVTGAGATASVSGVTGTVDIPSGGGAPTGADYLVGTADATLTAEIVVGTTPGGELGGTWGTPTVDATHSGSAHHAQSHEIDGADHAATTALSIAKGGTALTALPNVEVPISAASLKGTTTAGAGDANKLPESRELATNDVNIDFMAFDPTTAESAFFQYSIPKGGNEGTITFRVKWTAASGSGGVAFGLKALARSDDDPLDAAWGSEVVVTDTLIAADDVHISAESAALTIGGTFAEGDIVFFNLRRAVADGADTLAVDAQLLELILTFTRASWSDA